MVYLWCRSLPQSMVDIASENGVQAAKLILEQRPHTVTIIVVSYTGCDFYLTYPLNSSNISVKSGLDHCDLMAY